MRARQPYRLYGRERQSEFDLADDTRNWSWHNQQKMTATFQERVAVIFAFFLPLLEDDGIV
jgi:hypothetical protein